LGIFIIVIPLGYLYSVITKEVQLNPSKEDWILIVVFSFLGAVGAFIIGVVRIKRNNGEKNDIKNIDQK